MDLDELVKSNSKYLQKEDVGTAGKNLVVKGFKKVVVEADGTEEDKIAMFFTDDSLKPMLLNVTNKNRLKIACEGARTTDDVKGKTINVYNDPFVEFAGKVVGGLRIRNAQPETASTVVAGGKIDEDDDLPF